MNESRESSLFLGSVHQPPSLGDASLSSLMPGERGTGTTVTTLGFPLEALHRKNDKFICGLCQQILREPVQSTCGHRFCKHCLMTVDTGTRCQQCAGDDEEFTLQPDHFYPDPAVRREINKQDAKCIYAPCDWTGQFRAFTVHYEECEHKTLTCKCGDKVAKHEYEKHQLEECNLRLLKCQDCDEDVIARELPQHLFVCPKHMIDCPNACGKKVKRDQMSCHISPVEGDCENKACPFGCLETGRQHAKTAVVPHVLILLQMVLSLQENIQSSTLQDTPDTKDVERKLSDLEQKVEETRGKLQESQKRIESGSNRQGAPTEVPKRQKTRESTTRSFADSRYSDVAAAACAAPASWSNFRFSADSVPSETTQKPDLTAIKDKQAILESLSAVINREVEKLINDQTNLQRQRSDNGTAIDQLKGQVSSLERSLALKDIALAEQELRIKDLETTSFDGKLMWAIDNFSRRRQEAINGRSPSVYSTSFYTSRAGYKMCIRIYLNGDGMGKGTHISLFFVIMKGQYDAILPWPFKQKVTMTLRDQNNREHVIDAFRPDPSSSSFRRPQSNMNIASGVPLFCPLSKLEDRRYSYIKDDTMFLSVNVDLNGL